MGTMMFIALFLIGGFGLLGLLIWYMGEPDGGRGSEADREASYLHDGRE